LSSSPLIALLGPPNSGKSSLFNRLTGARQKVANYPGVTVEKREGDLELPEGVRATLLDLPGIPELTPASEDEWITLSTLLGLRPEIPSPNLLLVVLDATTLERGIEFLFQLKPLDFPMVIALTMKDLLPKEGITIHKEPLSKTFSAPVVLVSSITGEGIQELKRMIAEALKKAPTPPRPHPLAGAHINHLMQLHPSFTQALIKKFPHLQSYLDPSKKHLILPDTPIPTSLIPQIIQRKGKARLRQRSEQLDRILLHPTFGLGIFFGVMFFIFQSVFILSKPLVDLMDQGIEGLGRILAHLLPPSLLLDFLTEGVLGGVGNVISFLPQILILFFWIAVLEESGYLSRVAFLLDRPLRTCGMSGKSVIPLLSGFACAVPAIMATRTIEDSKTRLLTILLIPFMTCSARLPVYTLFIGAFVPDRKILGILNLQGVVLFSLYALGVISALVIAFLLKRFIRYRGIPIPMILEFPIYLLPNLRNVLIVLGTKLTAFLRRASTYIFLATLILWILLQFPRYPAMERQLKEGGADEVEIARFRLEQSAAGRIGKAIEPVIAPLGFDWKIGIGLFASFSAREVMISILGTIYSVSNPDPTSTSLRQALKEDRKPDGKPLFTLATALSLLVFYVYALQCISTVIVMYRELGGLFFPISALFGTYGLGYLMSFLTYQFVTLLGG
jgi:ferrous iron transport protein B